MSVTTDTVNLLDPELYRSDPQDLWADLVLRDRPLRDANGLVAVARHADVLRVERDPQTFISGDAYRSWGAPDETNMIALDDPEHLRQRRLVSERFSPRAVRRHEAWFRSTIGELVDAATATAGDSGGGRIEVIADLAAQLPCRLTARLLGLGEERWTDVKRWSEALMRIDRAPVDGDVAENLMRSIIEFASVIQPLADARRSEPADDLITVWANADVDGFRYDQERLIHEVGLFIAGGAETTRTAIAHGLRVFCDHPDQWEALADDPTLIPGAVEEVVRWVSPLNNFFRTATADAEIAGEAVAAGDRVILLYPAANRDPAVFEQPRTFDIRRSPNHHLGFGHGTHFCLGANLARYELGMLFEELTRTMTGLTPITEPDVEPNVFARAVRSFDLGFSLRT